MRTSGTSLQRPLHKRLMPLAYALLAVVGLLLALAWGALRIQGALAGFLNGESIWSKSQKQAVISINAYAATGDEQYYRDFKNNLAILGYDRDVRDALREKNYNYRRLARELSHGNAMPEAVPGVIFMMRHLPHAPYIRQALEAWRSTDLAIGELNAISAELHWGYTHGGVSPKEVQRQRRRIYQLNSYIQPLTNKFSFEVARGTVWIGHVLFAVVLGAACLAFLFWLFMARRILARIRGTEERYHLLFDHAADAIVMVDAADDRILDVNRMATVWSGRSARELVGQAFGSLFEKGCTPWENTTPISLMRGPEASTRPVETQSSQVTWGERNVRQAILRDVSERVAMDRERRIAAEALASIAEGVIIADADRHVLSVNRAHVDMTGYTAQCLEGRTFDATRSLPDGSPLPGSVWTAVSQSGNWVGEVVSERRDGSTYPELLSITAIRDPEGVVLQYVAVFTNITTAKVNRERLEHLATHDVLTGLVNRSEFERHCDRAIHDAAEQRSAVAVLFVDLDNFKIVNDSFSHAIGDRLLVKVAGRIQRQLPDNAVAGRIGGDEFTVLLSALATREDATVVAQRLTTALSEPFVIDDYDIVLSASVGVAGYPLDGASTVELIANADAAMYAAKTQERNAYRFYSPRMHADARRRLMLATDLRMALLRDEFRLVYQPSVDMRTGRILGVEALLRWSHPERGEISPDEFIPLAERLGLIRRIDEWVLQEVCRQAQAWNGQGLPPFRIAVNVSAAWFGHPGFIETLKQTLQPHRLSEGRILLEITESAILGLGPDTERTMQALKSMGIRLAIDDFGTGYSSLSYLKLPAVAYLKIDRSFIDDLPDSEDDAAIVQAMMAIAGSLGLQAVAEGVESEAQHDFLQRMGCPEAQGYLYSRPLPPEGVTSLLRDGSARVTPRLYLVPPADP